MTEAKGRKRSVKKPVPRDPAGIGRSADALVKKANETVALRDRLCPLLQKACIRKECAWYRASRHMCGAVEM